jgi:hypothetical protein
MIEKLKRVPDILGLDATLKEMWLIYLENVANSFFSNWCYQTFGEFKNPLDLYKSVWEYVIKNFKYIDDQYDESITAPKYLITTKQGDCDDFALFIKTVLAIYGIRSNFLLAGKTAGNFTHVTVITPEGIILDGTNDKFNFLDQSYINRKIVL